MSFEADLTAVLKTLCAQTFPDEAPAATLPPFVTYQHIGGRPLRFADNSAASLRHTSLQLTIWAPTRAESLSLIRAIEEALCAATAFIARPVTEPLGVPDSTTGWRGIHQDFEFWSPR